MSAPQFTPGPWSLTDDGCVLSSKDSHHHVKMISPWVEGAWDGDKEAVANMRLIAAAPELYALLALLEWGDDERPGCPFCGMGKETGHLERCQLSDALGKVRGEAA